MKNERDHPCYGCKHFYGYEDVEMMDTLNRGHALHVGIPICSRITYEFAIGRCDEFSSKIDKILGHDIDEIWDESDAPEHSVTDRLDSMVSFVNDFHEFEHICKDRGIVQTSAIMELYHVFIVNDIEVHRNE